MRRLFGETARNRSLAGRGSTAQGQAQSEAKETAEELEKRIQKLIERSRLSEERETGWSQHKNHKRGSGIDEDE